MKAMNNSALILATTLLIAAASSSCAQEIIKADTNGAATVEQVVQPKKRHVTLPGVGKLQVNSRLTHSTVIRTTGDGTETVLISSRFPNRLATPFETPRVIVKTTAEVVKDGTSLFISPSDDEPFSIFVSGSNPGDPVISLTLIPKDIPSQILQLQIDSSQGVNRKAPKQASYTQQIVDLLRQVASGKVPEGYSEGVMPNFVARQIKNGLVILPVMRYSGTNLDIYKYKVENNQEAVELSETSFYQKGVKAVSIYPNLVLRKGETTNIYVLADKSILEGDKDGE